MFLAGIFLNIILVLPLESCFLRGWLSKQVPVIAVTGCGSSQGKMRWVASVCHSTRLALLGLFAVRCWVLSMDLPTQQGIIMKYSNTILSSMASGFFVLSTTMSMHPWLRLANIKASANHLVTSLGVQPSSQNHVCWESRKLEKKRLNWIVSL